MRRMNGRTPNFTSIGLLLVIILLGYKSWTLFAQNNDLTKEIDKLQTEIKLSGIKQESYERKTKLLQGTIHDLDEKQVKLKLQIEDEDKQLQETQKNNKNKENEIADLKQRLLKKEEYEKDLFQQIEEKDNKIEELISDSQHILTLKNDAEEALAEKDSLINNLKREIEQIKKDIKLKQTENVAVRSSTVSGGPFNIPNLQRKGSYHSRGALEYLPKDAVHTKVIGLQGLIFHPGLEVLPKQPSNAIKTKPRFSIGGLGGKSEPSNVVLQQPQVKDVFDLPSKSFIKQMSAQNENSVIPQPPQKYEENLDTAVDDEGKAVDDPSDDQDEEGKEIRHDLENRFPDNYDNYDDDKADNLHFVKNDEEGEDTKNDPKGIGRFGALEIPKLENRKAAENNSGDLHVADDVDPRGNERLVETNFDNKVRSLGKYL